MLRIYPHHCKMFLMLNYIKSFQLLLQLKHGQKFEEKNKDKMVKNIITNRQLFDSKRINGKIKEDHYKANICDENEKTN